MWRNEHISIYTEIVWKNTGQLKNLHVDNHSHSSFYVSKEILLWKLYIQWQDLYKYSLHSTETERVQWNWKFVSFHSRVNIISGLPANRRRKMAWRMCVKWERTKGSPTFFPRSPSFMSSFCLPPQTKSQEQDRVI